MTAGFLFRRRGGRPAAILAAMMLALGAAPAFAAISPLTQGPPSPPATFFGSINDAAGPVAAGVKVEAYVGDKLCSNGGKTEKTGNGKARVTVYAVDVDSDSQTPGCGKEGSAVTIKIGDRTAKQTGKWTTGPVHLDITFGDVTPLPIPTFTPTPPRPTGTPVTIGTQTPQATIPAGSPGAGSPVPTPGGGVTGAASSPVAAQANDNGGGFPVWGIVLIVVGALAAVGGGAGYVIARNRRAGGDIDDDQPPFTPPDE
jgi:hypothetical protein